MKAAKRLTALAACLLAFTMLCTGCSTITSALGNIFQPHYETLEECFADPEIKAEIDAEVAASMAENEMMDAYANAEARAEGNVLIYDYTYANTVTWVDESERRMWNNTFLEELESGRAQFEDVASSLSEELGIEGITVRLVYRNPDGTELMSYDYANPPAPVYYASVEECMADPAVAQRFVDEFGFEEFTGVASGEGNTLVYALTFMVPFVDATYSAQDAAVDLAAYCEENSDAFTVDFEELRAVVDADPLQIRYDFYDYDGTQLYSHLFTDTSGSVTSESAFSAPAATPTPAPTTAPATGGAMTLEDYLANEDIARSVQDELNALVDDDFSIAFTAEGNTAIFAYTFGDSYDFSDEQVRAAAAEELAAGVELQRATFETMVDQLQSQLQLADVSMRIIYLAADGTEIYTADFQ
jgi:hypothetical protein